jgi:ribosome-binding protein aMBF1 (putative translation factor)
VDDIRAALEQVGMTVTDLAVAIRRPLNTVYKLSAKCRPPSQQLRAEIEAAMAMIRERAA